MKLYRFTALDSHRATLKVQEALGPDALIYMTRKSGNGVEILAGLPSCGESVDLSDEVYEAIQVKNSATDQMLIENLNNQLQVIDDNIAKLADHLTLISQIMINNKKKKKWINFKGFKNFTWFKKILKEGIYAKHQSIY